MKRDCFRVLCSSRLPAVFILEDALLNALYCSIFALESGVCTLLEVFTLKYPMKEWLALH